ncbi:hypothetical protein [Pyrodictium abyssi]
MVRRRRYSFGDALHVAVAGMRTCSKAEGLRSRVPGGCGPRASDD